MLDNPKQIAAFRELNKSGFTPSASVSAAAAAASQAQSKSAELLALILPDITYPASITAAINQLKEVARLLDVAASAGSDFAEAFSSYQSPSELITVSIGWDCYLKGENKPVTTPPALVTALADKAVVKSMADAIAKVIPSPVANAMNAINKILNVPPAGGSGSGSGSSTAPPAPSLSNDLVKTLITTCEVMKNASSGIQGASSAVSVLTRDGKLSVDQAAKAFSNAVGISVLDSMGTSSSMQGAITAITPTSVLNALFGGK
ncbi:hypothetical protein KGP26_29910 (plasmid) [Serratia sp. JSRIV002]|uniref:hypothetical protein n=1 Tax=Serratia sp. JSRIV002 TaxID=2831894 RepID=UPI001CBEA37E|nr:hypothetical protein [Serratia sp. JSRIV002]UAN54764.1 hypothetical protein KGP26_29910 [Serratia sp. JSRIV002]